MAGAERPDVRYAMSEIDEEGEGPRLALLEAILDGPTFARLERIGVGSGWRCADVGAGRGSVSTWLRDRGAEVVSADIMPRFLDGPDVRAHDICDGPVEDSAFDLVHCRALLAHVADFDDAVANLVSSARLGGWVAVAEPDYGTMMECDPGHPRAEVFRRFRERSAAGTRMDAFVGRRVHEVLGDHLEDMSSEGLTDIVAGGSLRARYRRFTMEVARPLSARRKDYDEAEYDELLACFDDPTFRYIDCLWVAVWGKRPGG